MKLTDDPRSQRCSTCSEETLLHLLHDCVIAKKIWQSVGGPTLYPSFFLGDLHTWIIQNLRVDGVLLSQKRTTFYALTIGGFENGETVLL